MIFQAGSSEDGRNFAAKRSDAIFVGTSGIEDARRYYADVKARAAGFGRDPDDLFILPAMAPIIGATEAEAEARWREQAELVSIEAALAMLGRGFNDHDFTVYDLDAPFPDVFQRGINSSQSATLKIAEAVRSEGLTLRQVAQRFASPRGDIIGTPEQVADQFELWLTTNASDGFVIGESLPGQLKLFVEGVIPILQARGLFRTDYDGSTFRQNLGIGVPPNRYTVGKASRAVA